MKICKICGTEYEEQFGNQQVCKSCYENITNSSRPGGVFTDIENREFVIKKKWTKHAHKKNGRIVGNGYAERQIADTLSRVGKVNTEL